MYLKPLLLFLFSFLFAGVTFAQTQPPFYNTTDQQLSGLDSVAYKRVLSLADTNTTLPMYNVTDTYTNGKPRLIGKTSQYRGLVLEGRCVGYYPNGNIKQIANYTSGFMNGNTYDYYPNGRLYKVTLYELQRPAPNSYKSSIPLVKLCNDSTGMALATNGDGRYIGYSADFKTVTEDGFIKAGLKVGQWHGEIHNERLLLNFKFSESYKDGKLVAGVSTDADRQQHTYMQRSTRPMFKDGDEQLGYFLKRNINYPADARQHYIQGRVFVTFAVENDGKLTGFKVLRTPSESMAAEALRVLNQSPYWQPGLWYGHPVKMDITVPITYTLTK